MPILRATISSASRSTGKCADMVGFESGSHGRHLLSTDYVEDVRFWQKQTTARNELAQD